MVLFGSKNKENKAPQPGLVYASQDGTAMPLEEMPDRIFADKVLGDGICILPTSNGVYSPVNGCIDNIVDTGHALAIVADDGAEIIIHIGVDTVEMEGKGFKLKATAGQRVKAGQLLLEADIKQIADAGYQTHTAVLIANSNMFRIKDFFLNGVSAGTSPVFSYERIV